MTWVGGVEWGWGGGGVLYQKKRKIGFIRGWGLVSIELVPFSYCLVLYLKSFNESLTVATQQVAKNC